MRCCDRYLFELAGRDHKTLKEWMTGFEATGELTIKGADISYIEELLESDACISIYPSIYSSQAKPHSG